MGTLPSVTTNVPWQSGFLEHDGEHVYWERAGDGDDVVVLCHGAGGNHAVWYQQVAHFAGDFTVVTWDQRGFGKTTRRGEFGPRPAVGDLAAVFNHLGIERAHVVGQSMGGWCALGFTLEQPERVRSLTLADTIAGIFTPEIVEALTTMERPPLPPDPPELGVHPAVWGLDGRDLAHGFLYQQLSGMRDDSPTIEAVALLLQTRWDVDEVGSLGTPTLFVFGGDDNLFPPKVLRMAAEVVPEAEVVEIPGSAHSPYFEAAAEWNAVVEAFLGRQG